jgi:hypothetical protein
MVQCSGNRDMQDQGWHSGLATVICRTGDSTWSGNINMHGKGWYYGQVTEICRIRDGTGVRKQRSAGTGMVDRLVTYIYAGPGDDSFISLVW